ncbi:MAG: UDP-N-acetylglucosamine pyrophosphorylase [Actinobacteria bacterium]|nr:UDP-N-acetylglucosamine pyrophosphorylase [Actinomycetota bacterium]
MELEPRGQDAVRALIAKGVSIPNPLSLDIGPEVDVARISGDRVTLHPGCRIHGAQTVISAGVALGAEGPVTIEDCHLGPGVQLKGGYFANSVFLEGANMGLGAHVRAGTLLEEEANGAHTVGLKQTILLPFVTLGSLINFCDCLMAGGTSRKDHSEVGSSYIHFNFTPDGTKATPSLFGDVPRGVMLRERPIFLGGQGGAVGPVVTGFGSVVGAGSILRDDILEDGQFVIAPPARGVSRPMTAHAHRKLRRVVEKNLDYLANLAALDAWYREVRQPFFARQELGPLVYEGALGVLASARKERVTRLTSMVATVPPDDEGRRELRDRVGELAALFDSPDLPDGSAFLDALGSPEAGYIATIQRLPADVADAGVAWLQGIVDGLRSRATAIVPSLNLYSAG